MEDALLPKSTEKRDEYARLVGIDGYLLLSKIYDQPVPSWLANIPAVDILRKVWLQQYMIESNHIHWRTQKEGLPTARHLISSPYEIQARYAKKNATIWLGYKVHLTETCEDDFPNLITNGPATSTASALLQLPLRYTIQMQLRRFMSL